MEREGSNVFMVFPQSHALDERTLVAILFRQRAIITAGPVGNRPIHGFTRSPQLGLFEKIRHNHKPLIVELLNQRLRQQLRQNLGQSTAPYRG